MKGVYFVGSGGGGSLPLITLYQRPLLPTYVLSYVTGDEGWQIANGLYNGWGTTAATNVTCQTQTLDYSDSTCRTLLYNNPFGNKLRFTDEAGGTTYANNVMIDNLTGIWWYKDNFNSAFRLDVRLWTDLFPLIAAYTDALGNNDYIFPPLSIVQSVQIWNTNGSTIQNTDFDSTGVSTNTMPTSSTRVDLSSVFASISLQNRGGISALSKSANNANYRGVPCRILPQPTSPNP